MFVYSVLQIFNQVPMDDSLPSSIGEPIAESTFLHRDEAPDLQISVSELFLDIFINFK